MGPDCDYRRYDHGHDGAGPMQLSGVNEETKARIRWSPPVGGASNEVVTVGVPVTVEIATEGAHMVKCMFNSASRNLNGVFRSEQVVWHLTSPTAHQGGQGSI